MPLLQLTEMSPWDALIYCFQVKIINKRKGFFDIGMLHALQIINDKN